MTTSKLDGELDTSPRQEMTPGEILEYALKTIQIRHGIVITSLEASWSDITPVGGKGSYIFRNVEFRAKTCDDND